MHGLSSSRWAVNGRSSSVPAPERRAFTRSGNDYPSNRAHQAVASPLHRHLFCVESAVSELSRYSKIVRRMKWKLPFLEAAYRCAVTDVAGPSSARQTEAELMFKLDFFEYYMLCERALVHLQGVFGITISRDFPNGIPRVGVHSNQPSHRYHANVLDSLDREDNPLHGVLGKGHVRRQLAKAKDLRNRWKAADSIVDSSNMSKEIAPLRLEDYDLAGILTAIHDGLDSAYMVAGSFVSREMTRHDKSSLGGGDFEGPSLIEMEPTTNEEHWGFMVDAMDWEAV